MCTNVPVFDFAATLLACFFLVFLHNLTSSLYYYEDPVSSARCLSTVTIMTAMPLAA